MQFFYPGQTKAETGQTGYMGSEYKTDTGMADNVIKRSATVVSGNDRVTADTIMLVRNIDSVTGEVWEEEQKIPSAYIGFDRSKLADIFVSYGAAPSLKDREKGLKSVRLLSFSQKKITVSKTYEHLEKEADYRLCLEDNRIVVYKDNRLEEFLEPEISIAALPETVQKEIIYGKHMASERELHNFLESYHSSY
ncbi:MAG: hypothetical protein PHP50_02770 [Lachnospiraceae bacterium]|nr:hypothetical protein [Lachnospiraceae bacterium]